MKQFASVLITGAGRGIGRALVGRFLASKAYHVIAVSRANKPVGLDQLSSESQTLTWIKTDISTADGRSELKSAVSRNGGIDILIHNAATLIAKPFEEISESELQNLYAVNVFSPMLLTQALLDQLKSAHIIAISSIGGITGSLKFPGLTAYSSSKGALNTWIEVMAAEYANSNMTFNALALGSVETEMFADAFPGAQAGTTVTAMADFIFDFSTKRGGLFKGKIISVANTNP